MKLLALDASTEACSVALLLNGECQEKFEIVPRQHTQRILPMVDALLTQNGLTLKQLDALAVDRGPGSFTGARVSTSVAQGLAYAADLPVIPVSSLAALAQGAYRQQQLNNILSVIDARMGEVYWGYYQLSDDMMQLSGEEHVGHVGAIEKRTDAEWHAVGSGCHAYTGELETMDNVQIVKIDAAHYPHARDIAYLASKAPHGITADQLQPVYLRDNVAKVPD